MSHHKVSISGPVEARDGALQLRIPLSEGGRQLARYAQGIGTIEAGQLVVEIPSSLAKALNIRQGSIVVVDNFERRFRITRSEVNDLEGT